MDEIKILKYLHENYIPGDFTFRFAESGGQHVIRNLKEPKSIGDSHSPFRPPLYYQCDGFSRKTYSYDKETKTLSSSGNSKGTVFEVLGDYHHSNPLYYKSNDESPRKGFTHKQNYEYTMNRLKHIEEHGYKVMYIWITDFKRFTLDLEDSERTGKAAPNLFDYMNVKKGKEKNIIHAHLLYKGSRKKLSNQPHDWQAVLDCI